MTRQTRSRRQTAAFACLLTMGAVAAAAQSASPDAVSQQQQQPASRGTVLFERHTDEDPPETATQQAKPDTSHAGEPGGPELTDTDRSALLITAYDLDARLQPATAGMQMRARLTLRNDSQEPRTRIALQISSTLTWDDATLLPSDGGSAVKLPLAQHLLETDADHTGKANEAILVLPTTLAPGAEIMVDLFYSGTIAASGARLEAIGATPAAALDADWDSIAPQPNGMVSALRGIGSVLWIPVAAPQLFLGDGARLFQFIGTTRLREQSASMHLRLSVEYNGEPPTAAYFCGRRRALTAISDDSNSPVAAGHGIASAEFPAEPLGFRIPSLFVVDHAEQLIAPAPMAFSSSAAHSEPAPAEPASGAPMLAVETDDEGSLARLAASAETIAPLMQRWFGVRPLSALTVLDHSGQPFEDGPLLVAPAGSLAGSSSMTALAHSMTHTWVQTGQPWMDEGLAQFASLLWVEQQQGREAALAQLQDLLRPLDLAEVVATPDATIDTGQPLIAASDELYYRRKAAAVWWMLRDIIGDDALQAALKAWCVQPVSTQSPSQQAIALEHLLEKTSGKDLSWLFADWILRDRGLPDLSLVSVEPHLLPAGETHASGWLVSVTVRNDGAAAADVPVVIRSGSFSTTRRMRIAGFASNTDRVLVETAPSEVVVNDGSVPEVRSSIHTQAIAPPAK